MTITDEQRPTIGERYSSATESSNLRVSEKSGDADFLIAAGMLGDRLGRLLLRLNTEFDRVRADVSPDRALSPTDRLLVLMNLKTLRETKDALGNFAVVTATRRKFMVNDEAVNAIAGRVLDVHLSPLCHHCQGRGFHGGSHRGERKEICRPCKGSSRRGEDIGKTSVERQFAAHLMAELSRVVASAEREMGRNKGQKVRNMKDLITDAERNV